MKSGPIGVMDLLGLSIVNISIEDEIDILNTLNDLHYLTEQGVAGCDKYLFITTSMCNHTIYDHILVLSLRNTEYDSKPFHSIGLF